MPCPIILSAFGTSKKTQDTYSHIQATVQESFPAHPVFFGYTSKIIVQRLNNPDIQHPVTIIERLLKKGEKIFLQPLHLIAGKEYHGLIRDTISIDGASVGIPLLYSEKDYIHLARAMTPAVSTAPDTATLILGHGTSHPSWVAYLAFQHFCRNLLSPHVFVGTVEKSPDSSHLPQLLHEKGYKNVKIVPFLVVAGVHYQRDILGDAPNSWKSRLEQYDLSIDVEPEGIGRNSEVLQLLCSHIKTSLER